MMKDFDELLFESIDDTFADVLGAVCRDIIFSHLLRRFSIPKEELPTHLNVLSQGLGDFLGQAETEAISKAIAKRLYSGSYIDFVDHADFNLERYVNEARQRGAIESTENSHDQG